MMRHHTTIIRNNIAQNNSIGKNLKICGVKKDKKKKKIETIVYYCIYVKFNKMQRAFSEMKIIVKESRSMAA